MDHCDPERVYSLVLEGRYDAAHVLPPVSGPSVYRRFARLALDHDGDPLGDPERLVALEGISLVWGRTPGRAGLHYGSTIVMPWDVDPMRRALRIQHERAHYWMRRLGAPHHTEADVIWQTIEFALPSWMRSEWRRAEFVPPWLLRKLSPKAA